MPTPQTPEKTAAAQNSPQKTDTIHDQMVHLLTGNLRGLSAARLRRRIARDPALARQWSELQAMTTRLQQTPMPQPQRPAPRWVSPSAYDVSDTALHERAWRRRVIAAVALTVPLALGVTGYRIWSPPNATFVDKQGHVWKARSTQFGQVHLYDRNGSLVGSFSSHDSFLPPWVKRQVHITVDGKSVEAFQRTGTHELHTESGNDRVGYAQLVPDEQKSTGSRPDMLALYDNDRFATVDVAGTGVFWSQPGLAGEVDRTAGLAWKLKGYASVRVRYYGGHNHYVYASQPLSVEPDRETAQRAPNPADKPVFLYSLANSNLSYFRMPAGGFLFYNGRWVNPVQQGVFTGYGRHDLFDRRGRRMITFDIQPLDSMALPPLRR